MAEGQAHVAADAGFEFRKPRQFAWKTALLAASTLALIPILLMQHELAATLYVAFLVVVHVSGLAIFAVGVTRHDIAPSTWGFGVRVAGLLLAVALLYALSQGLQTERESLLFWGSLFSIWAVHTLALALLHVRGRRETACPFA